MPNFLMKRAGTVNAGVARFTHVKFQETVLWKKCRLIKGALEKLPEKAASYVSDTVKKTHPKDCNIIWLNPRSTVLQKLIFPRLIKKFHVFYGARTFINQLTGTRHLLLPWFRLIQSIYSSHFLKIHLNIIFPSSHSSLKWFFCSRFPHQKPCMHRPSPPCAPHVPSIPFFLT